MFSHSFQFAYPTINFSGSDIVGTVRSIATLVKELVNEDIAFTRKQDIIIGKDKTMKKIIFEM